jgi:hypothetical protein
MLALLLGCDDDYGVNRVPPDDGRALGERVSSRGWQSSASATPS